MSVKKIKITDRKGNLISEELLTPINNVTATIDSDEDVPGPAAEAIYDDGDLSLRFINIKGDTGLTGGIGPQGATSVYDATTQNFLTTLETTIGESQTKTMTQKAITDELRADKTWEETEVVIPASSSISQASDRRYIDRSSLKWASAVGGSNPKWGSRQAVTENTKYKIVGNTNYAGRYAWLTRNTNTDGSDPYWCDNCTLETIGAGEVLYVTSPAGANYIYFERLWTNGTTPSYFGKIEYLKDHVATSLDNIDIELRALNEKADNEIVYNKVEVNYPTNFTNDQVRTIDEGVWKSNWSGNSGFSFQIVSGRTYRLTSNENYGTEYAWLKTHDVVLGNPPDYCYNCSLVSVPKNTTIHITAPDDANWLYVRRLNKNHDVKPQIWLAELTHEYIKKVVDIESAILAHADFIPVYKTVIPDSLEAYNVTVLPNASPNNIFRGRDDYLHRIAWFPKVRIAGGGTLKFTMNGYWLRVYELPWRELSVVPTSAHYKNIDVIQQTTFAAQSGEVELTLQKNTKRILILTSRQEEKVDVSQVTEFITSAELPVVELENFTFATGGNGEESTSSSDEEMRLVQHATVKPSSSTNLPYFKLLHYSDIHGSTLASANIAKAAIKYSAYINDVLNTGDVIYSVIGSDTGNIEWWNGSGLKEKSLFTVGNHDDLISSNTKEREGKTYLHTNYFPQETINALGYIMPDGYDDSSSPNYQACFWHKDYPTQKVRLIGLDCMDKYSGTVDPATGLPTDGGSTGYEQEVWLCERLAETLPNSGDDAEGYTVIVCSHYTLDDYNTQTYGENKEWNDSTHSWVYNHKSTGGRVINQKTGEVSNWHRYSQVLQESVTTMRWSNASGQNNIGAILEHYIAQEGSNFAAFICGHTHNNLFFYPKNFPNVLNVCIDMAGNLRNMHYADQGTMGGYIANILSFDTTAKKIKIVRLGVKSDIFMTPIKYLCYDYDNRIVIQEG